MLSTILPVMAIGAGAETGPFPDEVRGWALSPGAEAYTPDNLYEYIDGAAELYNSYGFRSLRVRRYAREGQPDITVDLFDMGDDGNAYGIFAHSQEAPAREVGQASEYLDGLLRFRQGRHYASLLSSPETPESRAALLELGRRLAGQLPAGAERPALVSLLPGQGLAAASIRYFRHSAWQNTYVFIAAENILGIGPGCEALLAKYDLDGRRAVALLVAYPDADSAGRALERLRGAFRLPAGEAVALENGRHLAAGGENRFVAAVWHDGGAGPALDLLASIRAGIPAFQRQSQGG